MAAGASKVSVTGIKPTGEPHLGNYIGAFKPALELARDYESIYFIADYHALTTIRDPKLLRHYTRSVAASWLAPGWTRTARRSTASPMCRRPSSWPGCWPA